MPSGVHNTSFNKSREAKNVSHKSRPAMQDMIPGLAPEPKMAFPFVSLGITERFRRPILDHVLLGTRQAYINEHKFNKKLTSHNLSVRKHHKNNPTCVLWRRTSRSKPDILCPTRKSLSNLCNAIIRRFNKALSLQKDEKNTLTTGARNMIRKNKETRN